MDLGFTFLDLQKEIVTKNPIFINQEIIVPILFDSRLYRLTNWRLFSHNRCDTKKKKQYSFLTIDVELKRKNNTNNIKEKYRLRLNMK